MNTATTLQIEKRDAKTDVQKLRAEGKIPAVFYGRKEKSTPITLNTRDFLKVWKKAGESSIIKLMGAGDTFEALIQDIDLDPVTDAPRHADFYVVEKDKKLKVKVPIEFKGISPAVKDLGGILVKVVHDLEIEALPKDLPHTLAVDISALVDFKSQVLAKDIVLPEGVTLVVKPEDVVASVYEPKVEVEEVAPVPVDLSTIELSEKKGKAEEEGVDGEKTAEAPEGKPAK